VAEMEAGEGTGAEAGTGGSGQADGGHDDPGDPPAAAAR
jgi:hypothetical protein